MSVPDKNISSDLYTNQHASEPAYKNDFDFYWNGGISETMAADSIDETGYSRSETDISELNNSHSII
jgi:hypothetical protein